jgi:hypothetical protein
MDFRKFAPNTESRLGEEEAAAIEAFDPKGLAGAAVVDPVERKRVAKRMRLSLAAVGDRRDGVSATFGALSANPVTNGFVNPSLICGAVLKPMI